MDKILSLLKQRKVMYLLFLLIILAFYGNTLMNGFVYDDEDVKSAVRMQKPLVLSFPHSKATYSIEHLVLRLEKMEHLVESKKGFGTFLKKMFSIYVEDLIKVISFFRIIFYREILLVFPAFLRFLLCSLHLFLTRL